MAELGAPCPGSPSRVAHQCSGPCSQGIDTRRMTQQPRRNHSAGHQLPQGCGVKAFLCLFHEDEYFSYSACRRGTCWYTAWLVLSEAIAWVLGTEGLTLARQKSFARH